MITSPIPLPAIEFCQNTPVNSEGGGTPTEKKRRCKLKEHEAGKRRIMVSLSAMSEGLTI